jgi:hypothetical protein
LGVTLYDIQNLAVPFCKMDASVKKVDAFYTVELFKSTVIFRTRW